MPRSRHRQGLGHSAQIEYAARRLAVDDADDSSTARESPNFGGAYALRVTGVRAHSPHLGGLSVAAKDQQRKEKQSSWSSRGVCCWAVVLRHRQRRHHARVRSGGCGNRDESRDWPNSPWSEGQRGGLGLSAHQSPDARSGPDIRAGELDRTLINAHFGHRASELETPRDPMFTQLVVTGSAVSVVLMVSLQRSGRPT
jgi:hypothetical protein